MICTIDQFILHLSCIPCIVIVNLYDIKHPFISYQFLYLTSLHLDSMGELHWEIGMIEYGSESGGNHKILVPRESPLCAQMPHSQITPHSKHYDS